MLYDNAKLKMHRSALEKAQALDTATPPLHVRLEPTESCNFQCRFCWTQNPDRLAILKETAGFERSDKRIGLDRMVALVDELADAGTKAISFVAIGDPLTYPGIHKVIERAHHHSIHVGVTSNLAMKISDDLVEQLAKARWIRWSMNGGSKDGYLAVNQPRGTDPEAAYERVQHNVRRILSRREALASRLTLNASVVISRWNGGQELYHAAQLAHTLGIDNVSFRPDMSFQRGDEPATIPPDAWEALRKAQQEFSGGTLQIHIEDQREQDVVKVDDPDLKCFYGNFSIYISAAGDIYPCCYTRGYPRYVVGNIAEASFQDVWYGQSRRESWNGLLIHDCPSCPYVELNRELASLATGETSLETLHRPQEIPDWFV